MPSGLSQPGRDLVLAVLDQLWVTDLTDISLEMEFVHLAVILADFSRRETGWFQVRFPLLATGGIRADDPRYTGTISCWWASW